MEMLGKCFACNLMLVLWNVITCNHAHAAYLEEGWSSSKPATWQQSNATFLDCMHAAWKEWLQCPTTFFWNWIIFVHASAFLTVTCSTAARLQTISVPASGAFHVISYIVTQSWVCADATMTTIPLPRLWVNYVPSGACVDFIIVTFGEANSNYYCGSRLIRGRFYSQP